MTVCCLTYSAQYWTYPVDRRRAQMAALQAAASGDDDSDCEEASVVALAAEADGLNQALLTGNRLARSEA